ncbi:Planctomycete cytochrome C [Polystyrenella longa]|uniref:Planctomycete cytochrome C n=1 Tax=Polystyrenella longa TaxID=2528007 RepID=A0A518CJE0_9PLAN|nr:DUF1553 domain-containing protein [Polystyrenella longa]QDU79304.1 Planctomycete cytochrome C [Polystyrenella longa]
MLSGRILAFAFCTLAFLLIDVGRTADPIDFERDIAPLLLTRCIECHNANEASGGLDLSSLKAIQAGSDSGVVLTPGHLEESYLWERVADGDMPPEKQGKPQPLSEEEQKVLKRWIESGATWPVDRELDLFEKTTTVRGGRDWWSLQPIQSSPIPTVANLPADANTIDAFIRAELQEQQLTPAPLAEPRQLLRRLYFDLIGLPPSASQLDTFAADPSPAAYEEQVDELLASPHFGERWARYWLDLARFAETSGYERDQEKKDVWKYRDYVINAFNDDKPYNEFILEQLAGDELPTRSEETVIATGFLRLGTWNDEPNDPQEYKYERLEDMVHVTSSAFLGLTVKCARCHDHKFDPITHVDYHRMASTFWSGPIEPRSSKLLGGPSPEELGYDVFGWTDLGKEAPDLHLLFKGDPKHPGPVIEPAQLSFVPELAGPFNPPSEEAKTTERRLQLANWIVDNRNPLTARVVVNRLWLHHFGEGLVRSPNNFGFTGDQPTHPELLDWLALELRDGDWRLKRIHKLMVMSRTYRQSSLHPQHAEYAEQDFTNRYWWRANRRRLDAEAFRDSLVYTTGDLDLSQIGGESFKPDIPAEALEGLSKKGAAWTPSPLAEQNRRSLYIYSQRTLLDPFLITFDFSDTTLPCADRDVTMVAPQALAMLNNEFVHDQSKSLAQHILQQEPNDLEQQIISLWRITFGRNPTESEQATAQNHFKSQLHLFQQQTTDEPEQPQFADLSELPALTLHLSADQGVEMDETGHVVRWLDASPEGHDAAQTVPAARPKWISSGIGNQPALHFSGEQQFLQLTGQVLKNQTYSIFAVVSDENNGTHREIFSNWNGSEGNSTTSLFLGSTGAGTVRFSDDFAASPPYPNPDKPFLISAINGTYDATISLNSTEKASNSNPLQPRNLTTPYVIGQQGNINGEFWKGNIAELIVFDRELSDLEQEQVERHLMHRYQLQSREEHFTPEELALASLCHVLFNSNEFMFID